MSSLVAQEQGINEGTEASVKQLPGYVGTAVRDRCLAGVKAALKAC